MGVGETEAKRKKWFYVRAIEMPIPDKNPFRVFDMLVAFLRVVALEGRIVFPPTFERGRQFSRRAVLAKENLRQRRATFLSRIPGMQQHGHLLEPPCHVDIAACGQHHNDVFIDARYLFDEGVLPARKSERPVAGLTLVTGTKTHAQDHGVRLGSERFCGLSDGLVCSGNAESCSGRGGALE